MAGAGYLIVDLFDLDERGVNQAFVDARTDQWDSITSFVSSMGNTQVLMATCVVIVLFLWWQSRQWRYAIVPAISLTLQVRIVLTTRWRWGVSVPSGHTGATTSVYLAVALCARTLRARRCLGTGS